MGVRVGPALIVQKCPTCGLNDNLPHMGGGGGMKRKQTSDIKPPKKSNIRSTNS